MVKAKQLTLELNLNDKATKELIDFAKKLEGTGKKGKKTGKDIERGFKRGSQAVKGLTRGTRNATRGMTGMLVKVAALTGAFRLLQSATRKGFGFIEQASKFEEEIAKFGVVFGQEAERVAASLDEMSGAMNRSKGELVAFASSFQDIFVPLGFARKEASDLSLKLTELAIDVGSFNNRLDTDVIRDFQSALVGSSITVRKYGILIDQARINQVGWALGLAKQGDELTAQQRVIARYNILLQDSADAVGDAVRTADSFANTMKGLSAQISDTGIAFGQELQVAVLETIKSMGGIEGVIEVVKVGFAAITSGTEYLIRTLGRIGSTMREFIASIGGANNAVALLRGEMDDFGHSTGAFEKAWLQVPAIVAEAGKGAIIIAGIIGESMANGVLASFGTSIDQSVAKGVLARKINLLAASSGSGFMVPVSLASDITREDAALLVNDAQSVLSSEQLTIGWNDELLGKDLKEAHARIALSVAPLRELLRSGLDADKLIANLKRIDPELRGVGEGFLQFSKEAAIGVAGVDEISKVLGESFDPGKVQAAIAKNIERVPVADINLGGLTHLVGVEAFNDKITNALSGTVSAIKVGLEGVAEDIAREGFTAKDRSGINIVDFINLDSDADQATVKDIAHRFSSLLNKVGAAVNKGATPIQIAPAFEEDMRGILRESEKFGVLIPEAAFGKLISTARTLGIAPDVIAEFRVLGAGLIQETKKVADGVADAGGQIKINFGLIGKDSVRGFLDELSSLRITSVRLPMLEDLADQAKELGIKVPPSILAPLREALERDPGVDFVAHYKPLFDELLAESEAVGQKWFDALGAAVVIKDAQIELEGLALSGKTDKVIAELTKDLNDRIQLSLGRIESLNLNEEQIQALGANLVELIAKGAIESDALEAASATVLETMQAELATLQAELAAGLGGVTGEQTLEAKLAVDVQAVSDDTTSSDEQKARRIAALTESLELFVAAQKTANEAVLAGLSASASEATTFDATRDSIERAAAAAKLASEQKLTAGTITAEGLEKELALHEKIRDVSLKTATQAESVRRATETLEAARSAVASGLADNASVVAAQRALNDATVDAIKGISDEERAARKERLNSALNIQIGLQENLNAVRLKGFQVELGSVYEQEIAGINATADAAIAAAEKQQADATISLGLRDEQVAAINAVRDAQIRLASDTALNDGLQRAAALASELGTAFDIQRQAAKRAAEVAEQFAVSNSDGSILAQKNLQREIELIRELLGLDLKRLATQERGAKGAKIWGDILGDQEAGMRLQADLAGAFDTAIGGLAQSFVDSEASWADFRDQFLMSISQMIVKALILAAIEATIRAFSFGFASGGVAEGVGSVTTGDVPALAMGGVVGGTMKSHSDDLGFQRGAKTIKAFADGGVMDGVGGLPVHQYAIGGIARTPQLAVFGEGRGAEAFVPLPDGKSIPVKMDGSSGPISVNLTVASLDPRTAADVVLAQMPKIRKELASALREGTDRSLTEGVRGAARR